MKDSASRRLQPRGSLSVRDALLLPSPSDALDAAHALVGDGYRAVPEVAPTRTPAAVGPRALHRAESVVRSRFVCRVVVQVAELALLRDQVRKRCGRGIDLQRDVLHIESSLFDPGNLARVVGEQP